jgi:hypothetical protein
MLVRDLRTGRLIAVHDNHAFASPLGGYRLGSYVPGRVHAVGSVPGFGHYGAAPAQIIYDGLGHPLGLPFLTALPALAGRVAALLPQFASAVSKILPPLQGAGAMPQGQPASTQAPDMMVPPPVQPPWQAPMQQPSMQAPVQLPMQPSIPAPMESPIQPTMAPPMQESMLPPMQASAPPPVPASMAPMAPVPSEPPGSPETMVPQEPIVVAPMRVQRANGETVVMPVRLRLRRRKRGRRFVRIQPAIPRPPLPPGGHGPGLAVSAPYLHGWSGCNGWNRY